MKRLVLVILLGLTIGALCLFSASCGNNTADKHDTPAGHPDELKDSTRFDPAPDTAKKEQPPETPQ